MHQQIDDELSLFSNGYHKCMFVDSWIKYICPIVLTIECVIGNKDARQSLQKCTFVVFVL